MNTERFEKDEGGMEDVYKRQDLDGAASHHVVNYNVLNRITSQTSLIVDFGGGVKSDEDLKIAFENGAGIWRYEYACPCCQ